MAGEVVQVGSKAVGFAVGDRVTTPLYNSFLYGILKPETGVEGGGMGVDGMPRRYIALAAHKTVKLPNSPSHSFAQLPSISACRLLCNSLRGCIAPQQ